MGLFIHSTSLTASKEFRVAEALGVPDRVADIRLEIVERYVARSPVAFRSASWYRWSIPTGAPPIRVTSGFGEGDGDDQPYDATGGVLALPSGSVTLYVHAARDAGRGEFLRGRRLILDAARSEMFAPREAPGSPLPAANLSLARAMEQAMGGYGAAGADYEEVFLEFGTGVGSARHVDEGIRLELTLEARVSAVGLQASERAETVRIHAIKELHQFVAPCFEPYGFEYQERGGVEVDLENKVIAAHGTWAYIVPTLERAIEVMADVSPIDLCADISFTFPPT
jgi:hypothetical protein